MTDTQRQRHRQRDTDTERDRDREIERQGHRNIEGEQILYNNYVTPGQTSPLLQKKKKKKKKKKRLQSRKLIIVPVYFLPSLLDHVKQIQKQTNPQKPKPKTKQKPITYMERKSH